MSYSAETILKALPHRYPFIMVDRIVSHEHRKSAVCQKNVTFGEEVLVGHFPGQPIYPGVLMIEMGLQTTQIMMSDLNEIVGSTATQTAKKGLLLGVDKFRFSQMITPGDTLTIHSSLESEMLGLMKVKITITCDGNEIAKGTVTVGEKPGA